MSMSGNGLLGFNVVRDFEEVPNQYPYALGNMSLRLPHMLMEILIPNDNLAPKKPQERTCERWVSEDGLTPVYNSIQFQHERGKVELVPRSAIHANYINNYPDSALFISANNWYLDCDEADPKQYRVHSPNGDVYFMDPDAGAERYRTTHLTGSAGNYGAAWYHTYKMHVTKKTRLGSELTYTYADSPLDSNIPSYKIQAPLFKFINLGLGDGEFRDNSIGRKRRLQQVKLTVPHETSADPQAAEVQVVSFYYRDNTEAICPGKLDRISSNTTKVREVKYLYEEQSDQFNTCTLYQVRNKINDNSSDLSSSFETAWQFAYRYRDGQQFLGGAGSSSDPAFHYLPLYSVTTPSGTAAHYEHDVMGTCEYQQLNAGDEVCNSFLGTNGQTTQTRSGPRRAIVSKRSVFDARSANGLGSAQVTNFSYIFTDTAAAEAKTTVERNISDEFVTHQLFFGRVYRETQPIGIEFESINESDIKDRWLNSGNLLKYKLKNNSGKEFVQIEYKYREGNGDETDGTVTGDSFLAKQTVDWDSASKDKQKGYMYLYSSRRINLHRQIISQYGYTYETRYLSRDAYNNLTGKAELSNVTGQGQQQRNSTFEYDNNYSQKASWIVGLITRSSIESGETYPLVNTHNYNTNGLVAEQVETGFRTTFSYHNMGNVAEMTDSAGNKTLFSGYKKGVATSVTDANGKSTISTVDQWGNVTRTRDPENHEMNYVYDDRYRRLTSVLLNEGAAAQVTVHPDWTLTTSPNFRKKRDVRGNFLRETYFDHQGRVLKIEDEDTRNPDGARIVTYEYDKAGRETFRSDPHLTSESNAKGWHSTYDEFGQLIGQRHSADSLLTYTAYCYGWIDCAASNRFIAPGNEPVNNGYAVRDPDGYVSVYNFRSYGDPSEAELINISQDINGSESVVTHIDRNKVGFIKSVTQGSSNPSAENPTQTRTYEPFIQLNASEYQRSATMLVQKETHPEFAGSRTVNNFDAVGNPTRVTDHDGSLTEYIYDPIYRLRYILNKNDDTNDIEYVYYDNGLVKQVNHGSSSWSYAYNTNNLLTSESLSIDDRDLPFTTSYSYDSLLNLSGLTYPSGKTVNYSHNAFGETTKVDGYIDSATYFSNGQVESQLYANGQEFKTTKDSKQRPQNWTMLGESGGTVIDYTYHYDNRNNISGIDGYFMPSRANLIDLTYDGLSRLTAATGEWEPGALPSKAEYTYNALGDIQTKLINGQSHLFSYLSDGKLQTVSALPLNPNNERQFYYDDKGNVTFNGKTVLSYNQLNQLNVVQPYGNGIGQKNTYDGNAMRVKTIFTSWDPRTEITKEIASTYHVYNKSGQLLHELEQGTGEASDHIYFNGHRIATRATHNNVDSDADGIPDYFERLYGLPVNDPLNAQNSSDLDNVSDLDEYLNGLNPTNRDSDGDGRDDEVDTITPPPSDPKKARINIEPIIDFLLND